MSLRTVRRLATPSRLVAAGAIVLALSATAYAAAPKNWVTSRSIVDGAIVSADIKNNSIKGLDIASRTISTSDVALRGLYGTNLRNDTVTGTQVNESTLAQVPSAALAAKAAGFTRITPAFTPAFDAVDAATGRANAPLVDLASVGSLKVQGKCFRVTGSDIVHAEAYATTTTDGALMQSGEDSLQGGGTYDDSNYLFTTTALGSRQLVATSWSDGTANMVGIGAADSQFSILGIDGAWMRGELSTVVRNGAPAGAPATFHGTEHSCAFFGDVAHSGAA